MKKMTGEVFDATGERVAAPPAVLCQACGLKFSALGYRLHRWEDPDSGEVMCVPESELEACFGMHSWPKSPQWYSLPGGWMVLSRSRLAANLRAGTVSLWQLRVVPLAEDESLLSLVRLLLRFNGAALRAAGNDGP